MLEDNKFMPYLAHIIVARAIAYGVASMMGKCLRCWNTLTSSTAVVSLGYACAKVVTITYYVTSGRTPTWRTHVALGSFLTSEQPQSRATVVLVVFLLDAEFHTANEQLVSTRCLGYLYLKYDCVWRACAL